MTVLEMVSICYLIAFSERSEAYACVAMPMLCVEFNSLHDAIRVMVARYRMRTHQVSMACIALYCSREGGGPFWCATTCLTETALLVCHMQLLMGYSMVKHSLKSDHAFANGSCVNMPMFAHCLC